MRDTPVLITGGAGFIGSHLVRALLDAGAKIRVLDNFISGTRINLAPIADQIEILEGDLRDDAVCQRATHGRRIVFHMAALGSVPASVKQPLLYHEVNATGTLRILEAARAAGVQRVVYSASSSAYGDQPILPKIETMRPDPMSPYAAGKLMGEHYLRVYAECFGLQGVSLRYFNVFGPRQNPKSQYAAVIPAFIAAVMRGESPKIYGDGEQTRDFCFVSNVVQANILAASTPQNTRGEVYNVACGQRTSLNTLLASIQKQTGTHVAADYLPARPGDVRDSLADITAIRENLGYAPGVFLEEGLQQTVAWFKSHNPISAG